MQKYIGIIAASAAVCLLLLFFFGQDDKAHFDTKTTVSEIKQIARLNTVQAEEDFVFIDTIGEIGVVYITTANINIGFDVNSLNYEELGDTLFIEMPKPVVSVHQIKEDFVSAFYTNSSKAMFLTPSITPELSSEFHKRMERKLKANIQQGELVKRAVKNAKNNMTNLFSSFQKNVQIVDSLQITLPL